MSTWPKLTDIDDNIFNNLTKGTKAGFQASQRVCWIRVFSGAVTGAGQGIILTSTNNAQVFKAAGELKATIYGNENSSGDMGVTWDSKVVTSAGGPLRPSPIVTGLQIKEGKDQISRECNLKLKCFSLEQMEMLQTYFLEPGYSLCIEYGWNSPNGAAKMIKTNGVNEILNQAADRNLNYDELHKARTQSLGDYDSFLGFIVGGTISSDEDRWDVDIKLRGAPGLPTFLQAQNKTLEINPTDKTIVTKPGEPKLYGVAETEVAGTGEIRRDRRFKQMFNQLPTTRQIDAVRDLMDNTQWYDFLNFDAAVNKAITSYASPGWWARNFTNKTSGEIKIGTATIEKEKLFSKNRYVRFGVAVDIMNTNGQFKAYKIGNKEVNVVIDISDAKIGAFPNMFSTKASKLVIPGVMPDFSVYFLNDGEITQLADGVFESAGNSYPPIDNRIPGFGTFVEPSELKEKNGFNEKANYWGYLKNLYINFDVFSEKMQQKNKNVREVLLDMLNEMSSAVNSFWNFQVVEQTNSNGDIIISVIDENWIGQKEGTGIKRFYHSGPNCIFLESSLDISLPSEMTNQIVSRRLALANNPDEPIVGVGGFFSSKTDLFLQTVTDATGKPRKTLTEEEKKAQEEKEAAEQKEAEKKPSEKTQEEIDKNNGIWQAAQKQKNDLYAQINKIKATYENKTIIGDLLDDDAAARDASKVAEVKKLEAQIDLLNKNQEGAIEANRKLVQTKSEQAKTEKEDEEKNKETAISNNLAKIDVLPKPELVSLNENSVGAITDTKKLKEKFVIYCLDDEPLFDRLKNDAFAKKHTDTKEKTGTLSHPLPIKYNFKVLGTSGMRRGDTFNIIGIPQKYASKGLFQITQIEHNVEGMLWTTNITGEYRQIQ